MIHKTIVTCEKRCKTRRTHVIYQASHIYQTKEALKYRSHDNNDTLRTHSFHTSTVTFLKKKTILFVFYENKFVASVCVFNA